MTRIQPPYDDSGSENVVSIESNSPQATFNLYGNVFFAPFYAPSRYSFTKERNLDRSEKVCEGEDVTDMGGKNHDIHIAGYVLESELSTFNALLDDDGAYDMVSPGMDLEVQISEGEFEGPVALDPHNQENLYKYTLDVVATGRDDTQSIPGVINDGREDTDGIQIEDIDNALRTLFGDS